MEASEAATATETPAEGQVAPESQGTETAQPEGGEETPDVHQELAALRQSIETRLPEEEAAPQVPGDFAQQLAAADFGEEGEYDEEQGQPQVDEYGNPIQSEQDEEAQLTEYIRQQAEAVLTPHLQRQELNAFAEKHPDIREPEVLNGVLGQLAPLQEQFGQAAYNPALVRMAYMAHKAEAAAAAETPAEDVGRGAVLETGGGQATPESEATPEQAYKERMFGGEQHKSVF